ncbi:MAG: glycosyltransferase family 4 protein [Anaerolineae bacterium]|jgi:glycosyltransferase involved in cell wall biosynthesis|nr:glycosyltransferase family 4 protein [Anaerolineae bacterium]
MAHIGMDVRLTYYRTGGISSYIRGLVGALAALPAASPHRWTLFHSRKDATRLSDQMAAAALWTPAHHRWERLALAVELARHRLDVLHSPDFIPPYRGARRHVITVHDLTFLHYPQYLTADSRRYYNAQIAAAVRQADHILAVSEATRQDLLALLHVPPAKITVQPHGVGEQYRPLPAAATEPARQHLALPSRYFLHVGTWEPRKNILGLLRAYGRLLQTVPDAPPLVLAGQPGWLFEETQAGAAALRLPPGAVVWCDQVTDALLPAVYNRAVALVSPSFYEGFGMPALEAMACGVVPIVSHTSSLPEVVGEVGLLIDPQDDDSLTAALQRVLTDDDWRDRQQQAARQRAQQFTWARSARIALQVYEQVLA